MSGSCAFMSCSTSPSAITLVASAMISMTRCEADGRHHLERARVDEVTHEHAGLVAEYVVGRGAATALLRAVDHVVVQQRRRVHELDEARRFDVLFVSMPQARPASTQSRGRRRLPPPPMMCSATWSTSGTALLSRARIMASTAARSARTRRRISSSDWRGVGRAARRARWAEDVTLELI
jgi:hypothetical protein